MNDPMIEGFIQPLTLFPHNTSGYVYSAAPQNLECLSTMIGIRISRSNDHMFYTGFENGLRARRRAAMGGTWLERYV
jgi:hypothetical protein